MKYFLLFSWMLFLPISIFAQLPHELNRGTSQASPSHIEEPTLPQRFSLKAYAPLPMDQGSFNNCVGWAVAYTGRTILEAIAQGWTDREAITQRAFDPGFSYFEASQGRDTLCMQGVVIQDALKGLKYQGAIPRQSNMDPCPCAIPDSLKIQASQHTIADYETLFYVNDPARDKIALVRNRLAQQQPVIVGMRCPPSFEDAMGTEVWKALESPKANVFFGHAVCVIGYDDERFGGAFEVQNSWGSSWGKEGYIWIRYEDFANFSKYAYNLIPHEKPMLAMQAGAPLAQISANGENTDAHASPRRKLKAANKLSTQEAQLYIATAEGLKMNSIFHKGQYQLNIPYAYGMPLRLHLSGAQYPYLYVLGWNEAGKLSNLYAQKRKLSPEKWQKLQAEGILIDTKRLAGEIQTGTDHLCVLFSHTPMDPEVILDQLADQKGPMKKRILKLLDQHMPAAKELTYSIDQVGFSAHTSQNVMIPIFINAFHLP